MGIINEIENANQGHYFSNKDYQAGFFAAISEIILLFNYMKKIDVNFDPLKVLDDYYHASRMIGVAESKF